MAGLETPGRSQNCGPDLITAADLISVVMGQEGELVCTNEQEKSVNVLDMA